MRFDKVILFLGAIVGVTSCKPLSLYNPNVEKQYRDHYNQMPQIFKSEGMGNTNFMITRMADLKEDTLNKADSLPSKVKVLSVIVPGGINNAQVNNDNNTNSKDVYVPMMYCSAFKRGDTLIIKMSDMFHNTQISHTIISGNVKTIYKKFERDNPVLMASPQGKPTDSILVQAKTINFELSSNRFSKTGKLYGKAEIETEPYYVEDTHYKYGYLKKRVHTKYLFVVSR